MKKQLLCIELEHLCTTQGEVALVVSIPGREGTLVHRWSCPSGIPSASQVVDIGARLSAIVSDAFLLGGAGVQQQLMLDGGSRKRSDQR